MTAKLDESSKNPTAAFSAEVDANIRGLREDTKLKQASMEWLRLSLPHRYSYNFKCLGRPIIQYPQDIVAVQELIWQVRPDLIIETGVAHGGSLILSASMLALLDYCDASAEGRQLNPRQSARRVLGIDIDIRPHNREAIEQHPLSHMIELVQDSSIAPAAVAKATELARESTNTLIFLDSNHTSAHVLAELHAYAPLVSPGSYCVVFDTVVDCLPAELYPNRSWGPGNSPLTAVRNYCEERAKTPDQSPQFEIDSAIDAKLMISVAPFGFLKRVL